MPARPSGLAPNLPWPSTGTRRLVIFMRAVAGSSCSQSNIRRRRALRLIASLALASLSRTLRRSSRPSSLAISSLLNIRQLLVGRSAAYVRLPGSEARERLARGLRRSSLARAWTGVPDQRLSPKANSSPAGDVEAETRAERNSRGRSSPTNDIGGREIASVVGTSSLPAVHLRRSPQ